MDKLVHILTVIIGVFVLSSHGKPLSPGNSLDKKSNLHSKKNLLNNATEPFHTNLLSDLARISEESSESKDVENNNVNNQTVLTSSIMNYTTTNNSSNTTSGKTNNFVVQPTTDENASSRTVILNSGNDVGVATKQNNNAGKFVKLSEPTHLTFDKNKNDDEHFSQLIKSHDSPVSENDGKVHDETTKTEEVSPLISNRIYDKGETASASTQIPGYLASDTNNKTSDSVGRNAMGDNGILSGQDLTNTELTKAYQAESKSGGISENVGKADEPTYVEQLSQSVEKVDDNSPESAKNDSSDFVTVCPGEMKTISCPRDTSLNIDSASYGYDGSSRCDGGTSTPYCQVSGIHKVIQSACRDQSSCLLQSNGQQFHGECPGTNNYLKVGYSCQYKRSSSPMPAVSFPPSPPSTVPDAPAPQTSPYIPHPVSAPPSANNYYSDYYKTYYNTNYRDNNPYNPNNLYSSYYNNNNNNNNYNQRYYDNYNTQMGKPAQYGSRHYDNYNTQAGQAGQYGTYASRQGHTPVAPRPSQPRPPPRRPPPPRLPPPRLPPPRLPPPRLPPPRLPPPRLPPPRPPPPPPPLAPSNNLLNSYSRYYQPYGADEDTTSSLYASYKQPKYQNPMQNNYDQARGNYYGQNYYSTYPFAQYQQRRQYPKRNSYTASCYACQDCKQCSSKAYCAGCPGCKALSCRKKTTKIKYKDPIDTLVEEFGKKSQGMSPMEMSAVVLSPLPAVTPSIARLSPTKSHPKLVVEEEDDDSDEDEFEEITSDDNNDDYDTENLVNGFEHLSDDDAKRSHIRGKGKKRKQKHRKKHWSPMSLFKNYGVKDDYDNAYHKQSRRNTNYEKLSNYIDDDINEKELKRYSKRWEDDDPHDTVQQHQYLVPNDNNDDENAYNQYAQLFY